MNVLGLMSGTSADGVDAVLAEFIGSPKKPRWKILNHASVPYPSNLKKIVYLGGLAESNSKLSKHLF